MKNFSWIFLLFTLFLVACGVETEIVPENSSLAVNDPEIIDTVAAADAPAPDLTIGECEVDGQIRPCPDDVEDWARRISVPEGFAVKHLISLPTDQNATSITQGPDGTLYVATVNSDFFDASADRLGTIWKQDGDSFEAIANGLLLPTGLALHPNTGDIYISHRLDEQTGALSVIRVADNSLELLIGDLPCCYNPLYHQPNGIEFGADGYLYMGIGARSDHGPDPKDDSPDDIHPLEAGILKIAADASSVERVADGLRNPYDIAFSEDGQLWAVDNGADFGPPERLHQIVFGGNHGWPYYGEDCQSCISPPEDLEIIAPFVEFPPHAAPAGVTVYTGEQFPVAYQGAVYTALWNPWGSPGIYRVDPNKPGEYHPFALGIFAPIDVVQSTTDTLIVGEYFFGHLFEIEWVGN